VVDFDAQDVLFFPASKRAVTGHPHEPSNVLAMALGQWEENPSHGCRSK